MIEKQFEQGKVGPREDDFFAVGVKQAMGHGVQAPSFKGHDFVTGTGTGKLHTPQQRFNPCLQFTGAERFAQVVVGPQLQPQHAVGFVGAGSEHDDGRLGTTGVLPDPATQAEAIFVGQHDVQNQ